MGATEHAILSASGAKKWLNCPGSVKMEQDFKDETSGYAAEGETAHTLGEAKIRLALKELTKAEYAKAIDGLLVDADMDAYTDGYRDFVLERFNAAKSRTPDAQILLEQKLDYGQWAPDGFGTGDCVIIADGFIEIIDLKYGAGLLVSAEDNPQLKLYALGACDAWGYLYDIDEITMTIYQPRRDNISVATIDAFSLYVWGQSIKDTAAKAFAGSDECIAGPYCDEGFCRARPVCRAYADSCNKLAALDFKHPNLLSLEEISDVIELSSRLTKWAELVKAYALDKAKQGVKIPGYKLVAGKSSRSFEVSEGIIVGLLKGAGYPPEEAYARKLRTVADMEKTLGKDTFNRVLGQYVVKETGPPTLAPITDKRPEIGSAESAAEDFKNN